ncbi:MAG: hypothetical protein AAGA34_13055 [Pseudomonadota bacterium]
MDQLPWLLARFLAWIINTVVAAIAARRRLEKKQRLRLQWGSFKLDWSSAEKFDDAK